MAGRLRFARSAVRADKSLDLLSNVERRVHLYVVPTGYRDRYGRADFRKTPFRQRVVEGESGRAVKDLNLAPHRREDCQDLVLIKRKSKPLSLRRIERELHAAGYCASAESRHVECGAGTVAGIVFLNPRGGRFDALVGSLERRLGKIR